MKKSLYDFANNRVTQLKNTGFNYEGQLFNKTISPYILNEPKRKSILEKYESLLYFLIEKVKSIKTFYNYTVSRDYKHLN